MDGSNRRTFWVPEFNPMVLKKDRSETNPNFGSLTEFMNPTTLLVLERTDFVAKLYSVDMTKATDALKSPWDDPKTNPTLEALADPASAEIRVLPKSPVLDLSTLEGMPEKIEGIALLDRNTIAVVNDNDFDSEESK